MKAMDFNNVVVHKDILAELKAKGVTAQDIATHHLLEPVIVKLATLYPTWTFVGEGHMTLNARPCLNSFEVQYEGETLGSIARKYEGSDYQICVSNDRIKASLNRGRYYKTMNPDKAVAKVRKMFSPKTIKELAEATWARAAEVSQGAEWSKNREKEEAKVIVKRAASKYVWGPGFEMFMEYVKAHHPAQEYALLVSKQKIYTKATEELKTINAVRKLLSKQVDGVVITKRVGTYVVEHQDKIEICDDNTFPEWIRNRIGMLKLIEPKQLVSNLGMRVSDTAFVIIKPIDLTDVSEGETE